jgi:hypothetical protein
MNVLDFEANPALSNLLKVIQFMKKLNIEKDETIKALKERRYAPILLEKIVLPHWLPFVSVKIDHPTKTPVISAEKSSESLEKSGLLEKSSQKNVSDDTSNSVATIQVPTPVPVELSSKIYINWNAFELALFEQLNVEIPVKNIWIKHAFRYRNPEKDMPSDFDENEDYYFNLLGLPKDVEIFINDLKKRLDENLFNLNESAYYCL